MTSIWLISLVIASAETSPTAPEFETPDCGVNSLYILLESAGKPASLETIRRALPPARDPAGFSMAELQAAATSCGVPLRGRRFRREDVPLTRPAIAHLETHRHGVGHFVALRPVGVTGTMVQIIEPPNDPKVVDYHDLLSQNRGELQILEPRSLGRTIVENLWLGGVVALGAVVVRRVWKAVGPRDRPPVSLPGTG